MCLQLNSNPGVQEHQGSVPTQVTSHRQDLYGVTRALETPARLRLRWHTVIGSGQYHFVPLEHLLITSAPGCPGRCTLAPSWTKCHRGRNTERNIWRTGRKVSSSWDPTQAVINRNTRIPEQLPDFLSVQQFCLQFCRKLTRNPFTGTGLSPSP